MDLASPWQRYEEKVKGVNRLASFSSLLVYSGQAIERQCQRANEPTDIAKEWMTIFLGLPGTASAYSLFLTWIVSSSLLLHVPVRTINSIFILSAIVCLLGLIKDYRRVSSSCREGDRKKNPTHNFTEGIKAQNPNNLPKVTQQVRARGVWKTGRVCFEHQWLRPVTITGRTLGVWVSQA